MIYHVRHRSKVTYAAPIAHAEFNLRLVPIDWPGQQLRRSGMEFVPQPRSQKESPGPYPARVTGIAFSEPLEVLEVTSDFEVEVAHGTLPGAGPIVAAIRDAAVASNDMSNRSPVPYLFPSQIAVFDAGIAAWAADFLPLDQGIVTVALALASAMHGQFAYQPGTTTSSTPPARAFAERKGVCQDFAHVMIVALRAFGIPAAYVSGYLRTLPPVGGIKLVGADAMHAWVAVWCGEELGWIGVDPTNDCLARDDHIVVAMGRDYADVSPIDGVFVGIAPQTMKVMVDVTEI